MNKMYVTEKLVLVYTYKTIQALHSKSQSLCWLQLLVF